MRFPLPPEVRWHVPEPGIILLGCRPLVPEHSRDQKAPCPICFGRVDDVFDATGRDRPTTVYCGQCDRMADEAEARLSLQRRETRTKTNGKERSEVDTDAIETAAATYSGPILTEAERRRLWHGNKRFIDAYGLGDPSNLAHSGREFLRKINQLPDWSLILDAKGRRVVDRYVSDAEA